MKKKHSIILLILFVSAGSASAASGSFLRGLWNKIFEKDKKSALWKPDGLGTLQIINDQYQDPKKQNNLYKSRNEGQNKIINDFFTQLGKSYKKEKSKSKDINNFLCKEAEGLLDKILSFLSLGGKKGLHSEQHCDDLAVCQIAENSCIKDQNFKKSKCAKMCEKAKIAMTLPPLISPEEVQNMKQSYAIDEKISLSTSGTGAEIQSWKNQLAQGYNGLVVDKILDDNSIAPLMNTLKENGQTINATDQVMLQKKDDIFAAMIDAQDAASGAKTIEDFKKQYNATFSKQAVSYANQRKKSSNSEENYTDLIKNYIHLVQKKYFNNSIEIKAEAVKNRATALLKMVNPEAST